MDFKRASSRPAKAIARTALLGCCLLLACVILPGCQKRAVSQGKRYELQGKVVAVNKAERTLTISHGEIKGYMDAMVMPFAVKDDWVFGVVVPNDQVSATLVVDDTSSWLEDVVITKEGIADPNAPKAEGLAEPQPGDEVPDYALVNQDGKRVHLQQYRGRALLLTFIYTRCPLPDYCTLMSNNFADIEREMKKEPALYERTHLLTVSFDPEYDTPKVLRSYGAAHTGNFDKETFTHWEFATGTPDEIKGISQYFGLRYYEETDQLIHTLRTALIAPDGKVFKLYRGNEWKPQEVIQDLHTLLHDNPPQ